MSLTLIDLWDPRTFDQGVITILEANRELLIDYFKAERELFFENELHGGKPWPLVKRENPYSILSLEERIGEMMSSRTVRAWHYSRLLHHEVEDLRNQGPHLATQESLIRRLTTAAAKGFIPRAEAQQIAALSRYNDQRENRSHQFCATTYPEDVNDPGVVPLLGHWGGEAAYGGVRNDPALISRLGGLGTPCVVELAVPLASGHSTAGFGAAHSVVKSFARTLGCTTLPLGMDLFVLSPLPPSSILRIHREGDEAFSQVGITYPDGYAEYAAYRRTYLKD